MEEYGEVSNFINNITDGRVKSLLCYNLCNNSIFFSLPLEPDSESLSEIFSYHKSIESNHLSLAVDDDYYSPSLCSPITKLVLGRGCKFVRLDNCNIMEIEIGVRNTDIDIRQVVSSISHVTIKIQRLSPLLVCCGDQVSYVFTDLKLTELEVSILNSKQICSLTIMTGVTFSGNNLKLECVKATLVDTSCLPHVSPSRSLTIKGNLSTAGLKVIRESLHTVKELTIELNERQTPLIFNNLSLNCEVLSLIEGVSIDVNTVSLPNLRVLNLNAKLLRGFNTSLMPRLEILSLGTTVKLSCVTISQQLSKLKIETDSVAELPTCEVAPLMTIISHRDKVYVSRI